MAWYEDLVAPPGVDESWSISTLNGGRPVPDCPLVAAAGAGAASNRPLPLVAAAGMGAAAALPRLLPHLAAAGAGAAPNRPPPLAAAAPPNAEPPA